MKPSASNWQRRSKRATGRTLYFLDEPTTALHVHNVVKLLEVCTGRLPGNTVVVIEHNLEVIETASSVIDLGPEGVDGGGYIAAWGPPEDIVKAPGKFPRQCCRRRTATEEEQRQRSWPNREFRCHFFDEASTLSLSAVRRW
uniref:hypothetical protein n=1 Tax=Bradyrhizobium cenepequi TaxID=2821403 RepID=UPI0035D904E4